MAPVTARRIPGLPWAVAVWFPTRFLLLLFVLKVWVFPGPDVTSDVSVIYRGWYEVLRTGTFPLHDVAWQYPPGAALPVLSPALLPFLDYPAAFFVLTLLADAVVLGLLARSCRGPGRSLRGVWVWVAGVPLLGPTAYARYDLMVTAVAVAALLAGAGRPRLLGFLAGAGALLKGWPVLLLVGTARGRETLRSWSAAGATVLLAGAAVAVAVPGALAFLAFQRDRGTEVESLGGLVFQVARHFGWPGEVLLRYGSVEFTGPWVPLVSLLAQALSLAAFGWLVLWRLRTRLRTPRTRGSAGRIAGGPRRSTGQTLADAAFVAVLLFVTTSRVISPQYLVWLVGLAAVCLLFRESTMTAPALLTLAATLVTTLEFPVRFADVVAGDPLGLLLLLLRGGLLVAASLAAARSLWRNTAGGPPGPPAAAEALSRVRRADSPATRR